MSNSLINHLKTESAKTLTENGAVAYETTGSDCLNFFATAGSMRHLTDQQILNVFERAFIENSDLAMKALFFTRDIREGLGERRVFRLILKSLAFVRPESVSKNIPYIAEFGRFDDLLSLYNTPCEKAALSYIQEVFNDDMAKLQEGETISLLAKWLPSINASNSRTRQNAIKTAHFLKLSHKEYRKTLSFMRREIEIIENNLRTKDYSFDYEKQPSRAMFKYRAAFIRNDKERYDEFLEKVSKGQAKLNSDNVAPYEIVEKLLKERNSKTEINVLNTTWNALPDYTNDENAMAVVDVSASMYLWNNPSPISISISLGIYLAERNKGAFHNHLMIFSSKPRFFKLKTKSLAKNVSYIDALDDYPNTDIDAVFNLILNTAIKNKIPQEEMPSKLVIISDMQFDIAFEEPTLSNFELAKKKFEKAGYKLPNIVFWNAASRHSVMPVTMHETGTVLVSGVTPKMFEMVAGKLSSPFKLMMDILSKDRYANILA